MGRYVTHMGKTKRAFETVYIDHDKLDRLKKFANDTRILRAVLAREAIDYLLGKHGMATSETYDPARDALKDARAIVERYRSRTTERLWVKKCAETLLRIGEALAALTPNIQQPRR
jgi:hypothetical protein